MNNSELVLINNNQVVVSSRNIAEHFGKEHKTVLRSINEILVAQNCATKFFHETTHEYRGQKFPEYLMNRDGFALLVMGFTGKEALEWKLKYIEAFNAMEKKVKGKTAKQPTELQKERLALMKKNAITRESKLWLEIAKCTGNGTYKEICNAYAANTLAGHEVLPLPKVQQKTYTATEVGEMLGVSKNKIGSLANANGMKTAEYGAWYHDKSPYSPKEVEVFRYNEAAVEKFKELLKGGEQE